VLGRLLARKLFQGEIIVMPSVRHAGTRVNMRVSAAGRLVEVVRNYADGVRQEKIFRCRRCSHACLSCTSNSKRTARPTN